MGLWSGRSFKIMFIYMNMVGEGKKPPALGQNFYRRISSANSVILFTAMHYPLDNLVTRPEVIVIIMHL